MNYLESLNPRQIKAVTAPIGPVLILAGAGAGKTKTITHRILHLIKNGAAPEEILAITFTNKAAKEMRERVTQILSQSEGGAPRLVASGKGPFVSTFHSLGVTILRREGAVLGISPRFVIFDRNDSRKAVKDALIALDYNPQEYDPAHILNLISQAKSEGTHRDVFREASLGNPFAEVASLVWDRYEDRLAAEKALDFDDLLLKTYTLLREYPDVRERLAKNWKHVHVDEYQDTNKIQYAITKFLTEKNRSLFVVGDIDQNIYSWRGARIKNLLEFEKDFPGTTIIMLEQNYRSTKTIIEASNSVIKNNQARFDKTLFTENPVGEKIFVCETYDETDEANYITDTIADLVNKGTHPEDIAVLYRTNFQSRALEEAFLSKTMPYQLLGTKFFERKEVKDIMAFIRAAVSGAQGTDLARIISVPPRGIGKTTLLKMLEGKEHELTGQTKKKVAEFRELLSRIREKIETSPVSQSVKYVITETGMEELYDDGTEEGQERLENLRELVTLGIKYDVLGSLAGIEKFLEEAALASDQDDMIENQPATKLMTVHASKGLEFDYVFIAGLEMNLFPHKRLDESAVTLEEYEEERRLFYVALTRARKQVFLTHAGMRTVFGSKDVRIPSEFISEVPEHLTMSVDRKPKATYFTITF